MTASLLAGYLGRIRDAVSSRSLAVTMLEVATRFPHDEATPLLTGVCAVKVVRLAQEPTSSPSP